MGFVFLAGAIFLIWIMSEFDDALVRDRGWSEWVSTLLGLAVMIPVSFLFDLGPAGWGFWRMLTGALICVVLLKIGSNIHEHQTGKPLIRLPKKEESKSE